MARSADWNRGVKVKKTLGAAGAFPTVHRQLGVKATIGFRQGLGLEGEAVNRDGVRGVCWNVRHFVSPFLVSYPYAYASVHDRDRA